MQIYFRGERKEQQRFFRLITKISRRFPLRMPLTIYVVQTEREDKKLLSQFPQSYRRMLSVVIKSGKTSFSFLQKKSAVLVLMITPRRAFLTKDAAALQGIVAHEIMHLRHMQQGIYQRLHQNYQKIWRLYLSRFKKLHRADALPVLQRIGTAAELLLKDLYANSSLIQQNYSHVLLAYYYREFRQQKICPRPVFYDKLKRAVQRDINVLETVFVFEFALLSIILPFQKYHPLHARRLLSYLERCYQLNMKEITRKCGKLVEYYLQHYQKPSPSFEKKYFTLLFQKLIEIIR